jgi:hypothetical protein
MRAWCWLPHFPSTDEGQNLGSFGFLTAEAPKTLNKDIILLY